MVTSEIYRTLPEQIAARLRQEVLSSKLKPGDPLREVDLSERFGVSRGPVREAFRQLTQQGLLVLEPNKGVRVAQNPERGSAAAGGAVETDDRDLRIGEYLRPDHGGGYR